jgi:hypothetical protein
MHIVTVKHQFVFVRSTEQPVVSLFCVLEISVEILCLLESCQMRMRMNMVLYCSVEYSQYISRCAGVHTGHVVKVHKRKINMVQYYS